ncbi:MULTISPECIES: SMI1/KNR4 family protein [unclassified Paenibacillus]|uniref:SMI1/KNR4 family protein n=1 Tax=unclassified Paenibacillus TaxID=185978 RepID=UPI002405F42D|nr:MULTISPECIES: SMI1/KNR4 family protein [unclassified Paenibacillus]MDF9840639.1 internalin A [Paenibacillus sp. PastF-2]MDF9847222.1 internalin A [Paenibacillus sp. PastM-2]MDF9853793.1 internalin A [Paenibacillus sp. PastF-1]MDH6478721.1 internalin A [Paenibacillus sp. PastH-2]MDH6506453.1 internalin A [Paenibacillus sp. PastM-3]
MPLFNENGECSLIEALKAYIPEVEELLNPGVEEAQIMEAEKRIGFQFPDDFRKLYMKHNGEGHQVMGVMAGFTWHSLPDGNNWRNSSLNIVSGKPDAIKEGGYRKGWVPFADDGGGSVLIMDLEPGVKGSYSQVISLDRNTNISYVIAESFSQFVESIVSQLRTGELEPKEMEEVIYVHRKRGHLFDDLLTLTGMENEPNSLIPVSGYWAEHFEDELEEGCISTETLNKQKMVFIRPELVEKHGTVSLELLTRMPNLKELIIHANHVADYEVFKQLTGLTELVIGGSSFTESDLDYLAYLGDLRKLALVRLTITNVHKLKNIPKLKTLRLIKVDSIDSSTIGALVNLTELELEDLEAGDLSYISNLTKLKKLELKKVVIPDFAFMKDLKNLTTFRTDGRAEDESDMAALGELRRLEEFIYPVGDLSIFANCLSLREIGVDASRYSGLAELFRCNIRGIEVFEAASEEHVKSVAADFGKYFNLGSYGGR